MLAGANAAEINWTTNAITGDPLDVIATGSLVEAVNGVGDKVTQSPTVNGVTFTADSTLLPSSYGGDSWEPVVSDRGYGQLLSTIDFDKYAKDPYTIRTFSNLIVGQEYLIQYWHADSGWLLNGRTVIFKGTGQNAINGCSYGVGRFFADAPTQDLVVTSSHGGPRLTAYQLRVVPVSKALGLIY